MATTAEQLILRGLNLVIRASFSPNSPEAQAKHFAALSNDIGPWFKDYADEIAKPAVDFSITPMSDADKQAQAEALGLDARSLERAGGRDRSPVETVVRDAADVQHDSGDEHRG